MTTTSPSETETEAVVTRFPEGADQAAKAAFAKELIEALDKVGCSPGQMFTVMTTAARDKLDAQHDAALSEMEDKLEEQVASRVENDTLVEWIEDMGRGIYSPAEVIEKVRSEL